MATGASLRPSDAAAGGFLDATNATIVSARFIDAYPNGNPALLLEVTFQPEDGKPRTELYSGGKIEVIRPNAAGTGTTPDNARMHRNSNAVQFIGSVIAGGFDESKLDSDISVFVGTKVFLKRKTQPKFTSKDGREGGGKDILLVEKVLAMPGEKKAAAVKAKPVATKPVAAVKVVAPVVAEEEEAIVPHIPAPITADLATELEGIVTELLANAPDNTIARNRIGNATFQAIIKAKNPRRAPLMVLVQTDAFLKGDTRPWAFVGDDIIGVPGEAAA